ncbi:hypothetical protein TKK_0004436 [Trichogramma kaykai]
MTSSSGVLDPCGEVTIRVKFTFDVDREILLGDQDYVVEVVAARAALHMHRKANIGWPALALYLGYEMAKELRPFRWTSNVCALEQMHVEGMPQHRFRKIQHQFEIETETRIYKVKYDMWLEFHNSRRKQPTERMLPFNPMDLKPFVYDEKNPKCRDFALLFKQVFGEMRNRRIKFDPEMSRRRRTEKIVGPYGVNNNGSKFKAIKNVEEPSIGARALFLEYVRKVNAANGEYGPPNLGKLAAVHKVNEALNGDLEKLTVQSTEDDEDDNQKEQQQPQPMEL